MSDCENCKKLQKYRRNVKRAIKDLERSVNVYKNLWNTSAQQRDDYIKAYTTERDRAIMLFRELEELKKYMYFVEGKDENS